MRLSIAIPVAGMALCVAAPSFAVAPPRPDVIWALKEITGLEHENGRRWRKWFEEEGRKAGMK